MPLKKYFLVILAVFLFDSGVASAAVVDFQFTGTVTYGGSLSATGSQITGTFSYDTDTLPSSTAAGYASYWLTVPFGLSASVNGHTVVADNMNISIWDNFGGNAEDIVNISGYPATVDGTTYPNGSFGFQLASAPGNTGVLASTALPTSFNVATFDAVSNLNYGWLQSDGAPGGMLLQFSIDSVVVPIPPAFVMMASGMLAIGGMFWRSSKRA